MVLTQEVPESVLSTRKSHNIICNEKALFLFFLFFAFFSSERKQSLKSEAMRQPFSDFLKQTPHFMLPLHQLGRTSNILRKKEWHKNWILNPTLYPILPGFFLYVVRIENVCLPKYQTSRPTNSRIHSRTNDHPPCFYLLSSFLSAYGLQHAVRWESERDEPQISVICGDGRGKCSPYSVQCQIPGSERYAKKCQDRIDGSAGPETVIRGVRHQS